MGWPTQLGSKDYYKDALPGLLDFGKVIALYKLLASDEDGLKVKTVYETLQAVTTDQRASYIGSTIFWHNSKCWIHPVSR